MNLTTAWTAIVGLVLASCWRPLAQSDPLDCWVQLNPIPTADGLSDVVYANGQYLASGVAGTFLTSADAVTWKVRRLTQTNATAYQVRSMVYGGGQFVAVGERGAILTALDGLNWTPQWSGIDQPLQSVAFGNDRFVAVGGYNGRAVVTSRDAIHWSVVRLSYDGALCFRWECLCCRGEFRFHSYLAGWSPLVFVRRSSTGSIERRCVREWTFRRRWWIGSVPYIDRRL